MFWLYCHHIVQFGRALDKTTYLYVTNPSHGGKANIVPL